MPKKISNSKGFILGELLIVIVILGILASIAARATKESKETILKTNLRALRNEITGEGGCAYDSVRGRICGNYKSTDNSIGTPLDTSWGIAYNMW